MKTSFVSVLIAAMIPAAAIILAAPVEQAAQNAAPAPVQADGAPQNLKVLPRDLTARQVREIMEGWTDALGVDCSTCHVRDTANVAANGRPRYNYADDSRQEKKTARVMYALTQEVNGAFLSKVPNSGIPVGCGTCHRGHLSPVPYNSDDDSSARHTGASANR